MSEKSPRNSNELRNKVASLFLLGTTAAGSVLGLSGCAGQGPTKETVPSASQSEDPLEALSNSDKKAKYSKPTNSYTESATPTPEATTATKERWQESVDSKYRALEEMTVGQFHEQSPEDRIIYSVMVYAQNSEKKEFIGQIPKNTSVLTGKSEERGFRYDDCLENKMNGKSMNAYNPFEHPVTENSSPEEIISYVKFSENAARCIAKVKSENYLDTTTAEKLVSGFSTAVVNGGNIESTDKTLGFTNPYETLVKDRRDSKRVYGLRPSQLKFSLANEPSKLKPEKNQDGVTRPTRTITTEEYNETGEKKGLVVRKVAFQPLKGIFKETAAGQPGVWLVDTMTSEVTS